MASAIEAAFLDDERRRLSDDEIVDVRDELLAKGDIGTLSVHDQDLFRDSDSRAD